MSILLHAESRVLVQGITGREATLHVAYMRAYGTRVVAGVSPGRGGESADGIPVYDTVRQALRSHQVDVDVLFVPARFVRDAALEAIEAAIPLVVILAEGVPHHDTADVLARAAEVGVRVGERRIDSHGLREVLLGLGCEAAAQQGGSKVVVGDGVVVGDRERVPEEGIAVAPVSRLHEGADPEHDEGRRG